MRVRVSLLRGLAGFKHSPGAWQGENGYGENLSWGTNQSAQGAVENWYREISQYNFNAPAYSNAVGHFTQLIWRNSKQLGCGMSVCNGMQYWVCRYSPTGNWNTGNPGVLANNVPALCSAGGGGGGNTNTPPPAPPPARHGHERMVGFRREPERLLGLRHLPIEPAEGERSCLQRLRRREERLQDILDHD